MTALKAIMQTNKGTINITLFADQTPVTVANFANLAARGYYNGLKFHRVIDNFMIQGGGFDKSDKQKTTRGPVANEAKNGLKNDLGTLAMARTNEPHSASAQFFINVKNNDFLNYPGQDGWGYAVFGKVVSGLDVVIKISKTPTGPNDVPRQQVIIETASIVTAK